MLLRHEGFRRLCLARERLQQLDDAAPTIAVLARDLRVSPFHFIRQFDAIARPVRSHFRKSVSQLAAEHVRGPQNTNEFRWIAATSAEVTR
jgi:hypothetical protein